MSPRFVLGRENVPCVAEVVDRSLKADCTDFSLSRSKILTLNPCILLFYHLVCEERCLSCANSWLYHGTPQDSFSISTVHETLVLAPAGLVEVFDAISKM